MTPWYCWHCKMYHYPELVRDGLVRRVMAKLWEMVRGGE